MTNLISAIATAAVVNREEIAAQIAALQAKLDTPSYPIEIVNIPFFKHDGSAARPSIIPEDARVVYFHKKDGALCVTHAKKRKQWADVDLFIFVTAEQFRSFVKSKSKKAI